ncbi:Rxlr effector protein, partial [Globisporangium splendens]
MSPKERRADVLDYFSDIASSSSSRSSTLPGSLWGGPESLRMAAKALQRKIFVLIETTYGDRKGFAIYKPQSRVHGGGQFSSAKEYACTGKQWEDELRQDTNEAVATSSPLPIVMKFANEHYNSLHFRTLNDPTPLANMMSSSLAKHLQGSVRSKAEFKTDRSGQFEDDRETDDSMEDSDNSSLGESVWTPSLDEREKFEPNQLSGQHGWSFASQENQLVVYHSPTIELPQQPRKRDRDETLMLTAIDGDVAINLNSPNVPFKKTKTLSRRLAIEGDSMQKRRDLERTLQEHWEGFQEQWKQETSAPFLCSRPIVVGPTLVYLTQVLREQVIEEGLKCLSYLTDQAETRVWITGRLDDARKSEDGGLEVLRLCYPTQQEKLSRYIICTVVYEEELQTFRSIDAEDPDNLYEVIEDFCAMLKQTRELKAAFKSGEELSEWSALSVIMAQVTMEVDSVEPSRITTAKEESRLRHYWNRIWGVANLDEPTSFWSIHPDATGGVAILTNPKTISETQLIEESKWTNRTVAIKSKGVVWINVYAPNKKSEREHFFRRLNEEFVTHQEAAVLGGDFNCVLDKQRDRYQRGVRLPVQCESAELRRLVTEWSIYDARELVEDPEWPVQREPTEHSTYWRKNSASRLDRFYIAGNLGSAVQWEAIELPKHYSDHQAVVLHMKWTSQPQRPRRVNKCRYPMRTSRPDLVWTGVQKSIGHELELMQSEGSIVWSNLEQRLIKAILRVNRAEKRQVRRYRQKLEDQQHRPANRTQHQLIEEQANAAREAAEFKFGKYMQATQGDVRHFFRRIANWQRDQTISRLEPTPGRYHPPNASLADIMGVEWHQITGQSHAAVPPQKAEQRFDALVYIPGTRKVTEAQNQDLMAPITEKERFLHLVLSKFGFGRQFVDLVRRMHSDTTAQYLVNGELSTEWEVKSGIRQGRPLAPLLFIVAAEILALAVQQDPHLEGIRVTRSGAEPHLISTFVDDSAVFLKQGKQLPRLMQLLSEFGQQSGLHVQPTKSSYICLNTAVVQEQRCGIPVLKHGETVRYLGIQIGTGNITQTNWEDRLQKLRTRLIIAAKVFNSVVGRVLILNSVLLPSILFTAGYIKPPAKVVDQLTARGTSDKRCGGQLGGYSERETSIQKLGMNRHRDKSQNWGMLRDFTKERSQHAQTRLYQTNNIHRLGWEYLCEDLVAAERRNPAWKDDLKRQMESLLPTLDLEWRSDGRVGVYFGRKPEQTIHQLSEETRAFWPSFQWNDNPWVIDSQGEQYTVKTVPFLKECNLASFNARRGEERVFSVRLPTMTATLAFKRMTTLRKLPVEQSAGTVEQETHKTRVQVDQQRHGTIIAVPVSERSHTDYIQMQRQANGVLWTVTDWVGDAICQQDVAMIEEEIKTVGWTFKPHPLTTHCPWLVHERTPPNSIQKTTGRARTRRLHSKLYQGLGGLIDKLNEVAKTDQWYSRVQYRLPADLWKQRGCLTPFQMWTTYRISTMQLNLFHPGRIESSACPSNAGCGETKETISHIVWSCKRAQAAWTAFLGRWIGRTLTKQALNLFLPQIASRIAPPGQRSLLRELEKRFGFITPEHSTALQKLWFIVTSSIPVLLWRTRVEIVQERQHVTIEESTQRVWTACVLQVRAVAHRMRTLKGEKINATCLSQLLSVLERQDLSRQLEAWATARLYFDGGARGNPGPGGSGWALIFLNERSNRWELKACGYAYMGPEVTNNRCEYSALKDGLAYSAHYLQHYEVKLEVFGDSQMIIAAQNGFS